MAKLQNTFEFVGNLKLGREPVRETVFDSGWAKKEVVVAVNESKMNGLFLSVEGGYNKDNGKTNKVYSFSKGVFGEKGGKLEVDWEDRNNLEIINTVADFSKTVIDLTTDEEIKKKFYDMRGEIFNIEKKKDPTKEDKSKLQELYKELNDVAPDRHEFIHGCDVVEFFGDNSEKLNNKKVRVRGNVEISHWNGKFYTNYVPKFIELVSEETPNKLAAEFDLYFTRDSIDKGLLNSENVIIFDTYILSYDSSHRKEVFFPFSTVLNLAKYDMENVKHKALYELIEKHMTVSGRGVYRLPFGTRIVRGSEIEGFTEGDLTQDQKTLIDVGVAKFEDFKPKGATFGESVNEVRLLMPKLRNLGNDLDFTSGAHKTDYEEDDLQYIPVVNGSRTKDVVKEGVDDNSSEGFSFDEDDLPF